MSSGFCEIDIFRALTAKLVAPYGLSVSRENDFFQKKPGGVRVRIADVASLAGLSAATVSRVLNDSDSVRQENRVKVLAAVERLGYRPNKLARNLRRQSAEMIGVVVADIENAHFTQMVRAVEDAAYSRGFHVLLCNSDEKAEKQAAYLQILADERASGVILSPSQPAGPEIKTLLDLGIPLVAFDRPVEDPRADAVVANNFEGARAATAHLLAIGHRSICMVSGPESIETGAMRLAGYTEAMREAGLASCHHDGYFRIDGGYEATKQLLRHPEVSAMVVANNLMALGALTAVHELRLSIPDDIAMVGLDDPSWAKHLNPPLTTLAQPITSMARSAIGLLLQRIGDGHLEPQRRTFDFALRPRGSCGVSTAPDRTLAASNTAGSR